MIPTANLLLLLLVNVMAIRIPHYSSGRCHLVIIIILICSGRGRSVVAFVVEVHEQILLESRLLHGDGRLGKGRRHIVPALI